MGTAPLCRDNGLAELMAQPARRQRLSRTIKDCERDVKGIHQWAEIARETTPRYADVYYFWCHSCGAVGSSYHADPKKHGSSTVTVLRRVQE